MRNTEILIGPYVWSCQNDFSWSLSIFSLPVNMTLKTNGEYIEWSFSIGYFERYINSKSDYLELLLSVYDDNTYYLMRIIRWKVIERRQNMCTLAVAECVDVMGSASGRRCTVTKVL